MMTKLSSGAGSIFGKIFVVFFLLLALSSLVLMDVRGVVSGGPGAANVASVNGEKVSVGNFERALFQLGQNFGLPREALANQQIMGLALQNIITEEVVADGIRSDGHLKFSDTQIASAIKDALFDPLDQSGLSLKDRYKMALRNNNMREADFEKAMAANLGQRIMRQVMEAGKLPMPLNQAVQNSLNNQTRDLVIFELSPNDKQIAIDEAGEAFIKNYYDTNVDLFQTDEKRSGSAYVLSKASIVDETAEDVQNMIYEIEDAFAGSDNFDDIAAQYNLTKTSIAENVSKTQVKNERQAILFELEIDMVSDGQNFENGDFAFVTVTSITQSEPISFENARPQIENIWRASQKGQEMEKLEIALRASSDPLAFARDNNVTIKNANATKRDGAKEYLLPLFEQNALNQLVELSDNEQGQKRLGLVASVSDIAPIKDFSKAEADSDLPNKDLELFASYWFDNADIEVNENALTLIAQNLRGDQDTNQ